ncbi:MAG: hypothetical protein KDK39_05405 [Leptospiraceae bacterium]|nr:hypothetical protein [Leptospiraceae bacterium]
MESEQSDFSDAQKVLLNYSVYSALGGALSAVILALCATMLWDGFDWFRRTFSNLASPAQIYSAPVMSASFIVAGAFTFPMGFFLFRYAAPKATLSGKIAAYSFLPGSLALIFVAMFTDLKPTLHLHRALAGIFILSTAIHALGSAIAWYGHPRTRTLSRINLALFFLLIAAWTIKSLLGWNDAIPEFITMCVATAMIATLSRALLRFGGFPAGAIKKGKEVA